MFCIYAYTRAGWELFAYNRVDIGLGLFWVYDIDGCITP